MTHLHSHHRSHAVQQRAPAFPPHAHLVNAPVSPLDLHSRALTPIHRNERSGDSPLVVDGEVITSITTMIPTHTQDDTYATPAWAIASKRSLLRRAIDDPYWILMTLTAAIGLSITATVIYGAIQIILTVGAWLRANAPTLGGVAVLIILMMICGGAKAAKCAGIHCGGCRR
jgi:uncharacterized BrkB/YihY/UPF0761 family membrane protein